MRKLFYFFAAALVGAFAVSCSNNGDETPPPTPEPEVMFTRSDLIIPKVMKYITPIRVVTDPKNPSVSVNVHEEAIFTYTSAKGVISSIKYESKRISQATGQEKPVEEINGSAEYAITNDKDKVTVVYYSDSDGEDLKIVFDLNPLGYAVSATKVYASDNTKSGHRTYKHTVDGMVSEIVDDYDEDPTNHYSPFKGEYTKFDMTKLEDSNVGAFTYVNSTENNMMLVDPSILLIGQMSGITDMDLVGLLLGMTPTPHKFPSALTGSESLNIKVTLTSNALSYVASSEGKEVAKLEYTY